MRSDPWRLLKLDSTSATEREVKSAYARLLKLHRPDTDPEGFQALHAAYTEVLRQIKARHQTEEDHRHPHEYQQPPETREAQSRPRAPTEVSLKASSENETPAAGNAQQPGIPVLDDVPHAEAPLMIPGHLVAAYNALHAACSIASPAAIKEAFETFASTSMKAGHAASFIHRLLRTLVSNDVEFLAHYAPPALLAHYMQDFADVMIPEVVSVWLEEGRDARAVAFAKALETVKPLVLNQRTAVMVAQLVQYTAFWEPEASARLLNVAFPHLPPELRSSRLTSIDQQIVVGRLFRGFPPAIKRFWHERLFLHETVPVNWQSPSTTDALDYLVNIRGHTWPGWNVVQRFIPEDVWKDMWRRMNVRAASMQAGASESSRSVSGFAVAAFIGFWILMGNGHRLFKSHEEDPPPRRNSSRAYSSPATTPASLPPPAPKPAQPLVLRLEFLQNAPPPRIEAPKPSGTISPIITPPNRP